MRTVPVEVSSIEEAGSSLLEFAINPDNWVPTGEYRAEPAHLRMVGSTQICAAIDVSDVLDTWLHVSFRAPGLSPMKAADLLESFVKGRFPFNANVEWAVEIDARRWIHFSRRYTTAVLEA